MPKYVFEIKKYSVDDIKARLKLRAQTLRRAGDMAPI